MRCSDRWPPQPDRETRAAQGGFPGALFRRETGPAGRLAHSRAYLLRRNVMCEIFRTSKAAASAAQPVSRTPI